MRRFTFVVLCLAALPGCRPPADTDPRPYQERRAGFATKLVRKGEAPQRYRNETPPAGVQEVVYVSGDLRLKAWLASPRNYDKNKKYPALVYFHGGFAFGADDLRECQAFQDAGFIVLCPMLRGENGNPGHFELLFGEVDDGKAAVKWLVDKVPAVDPKRVYTFGHSVGGGLSAVLSLADDVPIKHGGSAGGLYDVDFFDEMGGDCPFNRGNGAERRLRVLLSNVKDMKRPHYAYLGKRDQFRKEADKGRKENAACNGKLEVIDVDGDHQGCLQPALRAYLERIRKEEAAGANQNQ